MGSPQVLHIEDDAPLRRSLLLTLADEGFEVLEAATGAQGLRQLDREPDGVLLDLGLPDIDGFELCRRVRARTPGPVLILSVQSAPDDVARALAAGADDFLVKPFPAVDLARHLRALLAPVSVHGSPGHDAGDDDDVAGRRDGPLALTVTESRLLSELTAHSGHSVNRQELLQRVWGMPPVAGSAVLLARIHSLRGKLETAGRGSIDTTGTGYLLQASAQAG